MIGAERVALRGAGPGDHAALPGLLQEHAGRSVCFPPALCRRSCRPVLLTYACVSCPACGDALQCMILLSATYLPYPSYLTYPLHKRTTAPLLLRGVTMRDPPLLRAPLPLRHRQGPGGLPPAARVGHPRDPADGEGARVPGKLCTCVSTCVIVPVAFTATLPSNTTTCLLSSPINTTNTNTIKQENYHEFCRLLGRLKANYQLCELVRTEGVKA